MDQSDEAAQASAKLAQQVRENPTSFTGRDVGSLSALLNADRPDNPFFDLQQYLSDLSMSAARAQNRKPKAATPINAAISADSTAEMLAALEAMTEEKLKPQLVPAEELPRAVQDWKDRAAAHRLAPNLPLDCFIATFAPVWQRMSRFTYSEGKYLTEIGATSSRAVDAIHRSVERLDPAITRQNVVTAFRSWRKEKQD